MWCKNFSPCLKFPPHFCQAKWPAHAQPIGPDGTCVTQLRSINFARPCKCLKCETRVENHSCSILLRLEMHGTWISQFSSAPHISTVVARKGRHAGSRGRKAVEKSLPPFSHFTLSDPIDSRRLLRSPESGASEGKGCQGIEMSCFPSEPLNLFFSGRYLL